MTYLGFAILAVVLLALVGVLVWLLGRAQRNEGSLHGGGYQGSGDAGIGGGSF